MKKRKKIAVVTGASSGIGRAFVLALDKQAEHEEIWVIARREGLLRSLCLECKTQIKPLCLDLLKKESFLQLLALLKKEEPLVATLVNSAGVGLFGAFLDDSLQGQSEMIDLNCKALTKMCYLCLPYMERGGRIYQMGSLSALQPVPYVGVYGAGKAYVLSFSRALNRELAPRGIRVLAVCPGWVRTDFFKRAVRDDTVCYYNRFSLPEQVVKRAFWDMRRKKEISICGLGNRLQALLAKLLPHRLLMEIWCIQQKNP